MTSHLLARHRPFLLNRNLYAGGQRYAAIWTGDCVSIWPHLQMQLPMMMNMGLSGCCCWAHDVGGYRRTQPYSVESIRTTRLTECDESLSKPEDISRHRVKSE